MITSNLQGVKKRALDGNASDPERGLQMGEYVPRFASSGLEAARKAVLGGAVWQRCQFHLQRNAQAYVPRKEMQAEVAEDIRTIIDKAFD